MRASAFLLGNGRRALLGFIASLVVVVGQEARRAEVVVRHGRADRTKWRRVQKALRCVCFVAVGRKGKHGLVVVVVVEVIVGEVA